MFAIQNGKKFVAAKFFLDPNNIFTYEISSKPKCYKNKEEAERVMAIFEKHIQGCIERVNKSIVENEKTLAKESSNIERLTASLEGLYKQPFIEVENEVVKVRKKLHNATDKVDIAIAYQKDYKKAIPRYQKILTSGLSVVKVNQTVENV